MKIPKLSLMSDVVEKLGKAKDIKTLKSFFPRTEEGAKIPDEAKPMFAKCLLYKLAGQTTAEAMDEFMGGDTEAFDILREYYPDAVKEEEENKKAENSSQSVQTEGSEALNLVSAGGSTTNPDGSGTASSPQPSSTTPPESPSSTSGQTGGSTSDQSSSSTSGQPVSGTPGQPPSSTSGQTGGSTTGQSPSVTSQQSSSSAPPQTEGSAPAQPGKPKKLMINLKVPEEDEQWFDQWAPEGSDNDSERYAGKISLPLRKRIAELHDKPRYMNTSRALPFEEIREQEGSSTESSTGSPEGHEAAPKPQSPKTPAAASPTTGLQPGEPPATDPRTTGEPPATDPRTTGEPSAANSPTTGQQPGGTPEQNPLIPSEEAT
ncbi:MAG: hypothetical protein K5655_08760 [Lachnospiraceae bacterium]|nr:hypothetical protein [Lachnospiraceae bacterium]